MSFAAGDGGMERRPRMTVNLDMAAQVRICILDGSQLADDRTT
jgi:hypothetical protein